MYPSSPFAEKYADPPTSSCNLEVVVEPCPNCWLNSSSYCCPKSTIGAPRSDRRHVLFAGRAASGERIYGFLVHPSCQDKMVLSFQERGSPSCGFLCFFWVLLYYRVGHCCATQLRDMAPPAGLLTTWVNENETRMYELLTPCS